MGIEVLKIRLSGGVSNTNPLLSYGGAMSTDAGGLVYSQTATSASNIPGVTLVYGAGNAVSSTGTLIYNCGEKTVSWMEPGATTYGPAVYIATNGTYTVRGTGTGYLVISVVSASLSPTVNYSITVTIANVAERIFDDADKESSYAGMTDYRFLYIENSSITTAAKNVQIMLLADTPGVDTLSIAKGNAAVNGTETAPADRFTAPSPALSWSGQGITLTIGDIPATQKWGFWVRRVVPASTVDGVTANTFTVKLTALV